MCRTGIVSRSKVPGSNPSKIGFEFSVKTSPNGYFGIVKLKCMLIEGARNSFGLIEICPGYSSGFETNTRPGIGHMA